MPRWCWHRVGVQSVGSNLSINNLDCIVFSVLVMVKVLSASSITPVVMAPQNLLFFCFRILHCARTKITTPTKKILNEAYYKIIAGIICFVTMLLRGGKRQRWYRPVRERTLLLFIWSGIVGVFNMAQFLKYQTNKASLKLIFQVGDILSDELNPPIITPIRCLIYLTVTFAIL